MSNKDLKAKSYRYLIKTTTTDLLVVTANGYQECGAPHNRYLSFYNYHGASERDEVVRVSSRNIIYMRPMSDDENAPITATVIGSMED